MAVHNYIYVLFVASIQLWLSCLLNKPNIVKILKVEIFGGKKVAILKWLRVPNFQHRN